MFWSLMDEFWGVSNTLSITGYLHYLNSMKEAGPMNGRKVFLKRLNICNDSGNQPGLLVISSLCGILCKSYFMFILNTVGSFPARLKLRERVLEG